MIGFKNEIEFVWYNNHGLYKVLTPKFFIVCVEIFVVLIISHDGYVRVRKHFQKTETTQFWFIGPISSWGVIDKRMEDGWRIKKFVSALRREIYTNFHPTSEEDGDTIDGPRRQSWPSSLIHPPGVCDSQILTMTPIIIIIPSPGAQIRFQRFTERTFQANMCQSTSNLKNFRSEILL